MADDDPEDIDLLKRSELAELDGPAYTVACVLDDWLHRLHGVTSGSYGAGLFLDLLAAEGWRVEPIDVPPLLEVEFPAKTTAAEVARFKEAHARLGGKPARFRQKGYDGDV